MKNLRRICLLLLCLLLVLSISVPVFAQNVATSAPEITAGSVTLDAQSPLGGSEKLLDTAKAVILYELGSDTLVYAWNPDALVDPSGMNKLMTALLALEKGNPDDIVTVTRSAVNSVAIGSVSAGLKAGEEISLRNLLYCMMVGSANDAAAVIAEHIGMTQELFVDMMNQRALELGCQNTYFMNANGLSQEGQFTTARDLAKITAAALGNELFVEMFRAVNYTVPATNKVKERYVVTTNYLMSKEKVKNQYDSRVTGGKTGALSTTDRSLICTAEYGDKEYLVVVMSARGTVTADGLAVKTFGSFEETRVLLDYGFGQYAFRQVLQAGQVMGQFAVSGGENDVAACPSQDMMATLPVELVSEELTYRCVVDENGITAPIKKDQVIGRVEAWYKGICVGRSDLVAMHDVYSEGEHMVSLTPNAERTSDQQMRMWLIVGGIALVALIVITAIVLLVLHLVRQHQLNRRHKLINGGKR